MENLCVRCNEKSIVIKKRGLCLRCYNKELYRSKKAGTKPVLEIRWGAEIEFIKNFFTHRNWIYHPAFFRLSGRGYEPDFYDGERNVFIEVSGTRQAFQSNFEKYKLFIKTYPKIKFEIRDILGNIKPLTKRIYATKGNLNQK